MRAHFQQHWARCRLVAGTPQQLLTGGDIASFGAEASSRPLSPAALLAIVLLPTAQQFCHFQLLDLRSSQFLDRRKTSARWTVVSEMSISREPGWSFGVHFQDSSVLLRSAQTVHRSLAPARCNPAARCPAGCPRHRRTPSRNRRRRDRRTGHRCRRRVRLTG